MIIFKRMMFVSLLLICFYCFMSQTKALNGQVDSTDANLSDISINHGTLSPVFSGDITDYTLSLTKCENITIIPFACCANASIEINGIPCQSGYPCTIPITDELYSINIKVAAENGIQKQYNINLTLNSQNSPGLLNLTVSSGNLSPAFNTAVTNYTLDVSCVTESLDVTAFANDGTKTISVNNNPAENGKAVSVPLKTGTNMITVATTAENCTSKTYILTVTREEMPVPALSGLKFSAGSLSPAFSQSNTTYSLIVDSSVKSVNITPTGNISAKSISINNNIVQSACGYSLDLNFGDNSVSITVTNANGLSVTYVVIITRETPEEGTLQGLSISAGTLSPSFSSSQLSYSAKVDGDTSEIDISPTDDINTDNILVNGTPVGSGESFRMPLLVGANTAVIAVTTKSGASRTYTFSVTRDAATSPGLSSLSMSAGTLSPTFSSRTLNYTAKVSFETGSITMTPTARDNTQAITIAGKSFRSGSDCTIPLSVGTNHIQLTVSMSDGTSKTYNLDVTRSVETPSGLKELSLSSGVLSPAFSPDITDYSAKVDNCISDIYINALADDLSAKIKISGTTTGNESLSVGSNVITVTVTSVDGSVKTYTLNIFRGYKTKVTVDSKSDGERYIAQVPDYLPLLDDSDNFDFELGDNSVIISAGVLKKNKGTGNLCVTNGDTPQDTLKTASELTDDDCAAIFGTDIEFEGGSAASGSVINAGAVISFGSKERDYLNLGTPVVFYLDSAAGKLQNVGASFDLNNKTASFTAPKTGSYIIAVKLKSSSVSYTVKADANYTLSGGTKTFNAEICRGFLSSRLKDAKLMIVTTLSTGTQSYMFVPLKGDSSDVSITVDGRATHSDIYLISGSFDGGSVPNTYALTQSVCA